MSDLQELLIGVMLVIMVVVALTACLPRDGKMAWFVEKPFLETGASLLLITTFSVGLLLLVNRFTAIDDVALSGKVENATGR